VVLKFGRVLCGLPHQPCRMGDSHSELDLELVHILDAFLHPLKVVSTLSGLQRRAPHVMAHRYALRPLFARVTFRLQYLQRFHCQHLPYHIIVPVESANTLCQVNFAVGPIGYESSGPIEVPTGVKVDIEEGGVFVTRTKPRQGETEANCLACYMRHRPNGTHLARN
jgi:hypothetical protein